MRTALLLVVVLVAGCGGAGSGEASKGEYEKSMSAVAPALQGQLLKERFALEAVRVPARARIQLRRDEGHLRAGIASLQAIAPPDDVKAEHARLIGGYRALLAEYKALEADAHGKTTDALRVKAGRLSSAPALKAIADALRAIIAKGYDLGFPTQS